MSNLKAKFQCNSVRTVAGYHSTLGQIEHEDVELSAIYAPSDKENEEDNQFSEATPSGKLSMYISNPNALGFFKPGITYYLNIEPCPKDRQSDPERFDKAFEGVE